MKLILTHVAPLILSICGVYFVPDITRDYDLSLGLLWGAACITFASLDALVIIGRIHAVSQLRLPLWARIRLLDLTISELDRQLDRLADFENSVGFDCDEDRVTFLLQK